MIAGMKAVCLTALLVFSTVAFAQFVPPAVSTPNEQARFLSGLRVPGGSALAPLQQASEYLEHTRNYATTWKRFDERYFSKMRAFSGTQIVPRIGSTNTLFYLFGGPDFINAYALFPDASTYILGGLEPVGSMVPPEQLDPPRILAGLDNLRKSTSVTLQFSHFITKDMKTELDQTDFRGVLPILLSFIALGGGEVLSVQYIGIDSAGSMQLLAGPSVVRGMLPGVQIRFRKDPLAPPQTVYYVQADASDGALKSNPALTKWMAGFGPATSYLKAASYLLHEPYFSRIRSFLLEHSRAILQDDSGIPLAAFRGGNWRIIFFGAYTGTLDIFQKYAQPELAQIYGSGAIPLDFGTGYKWKQGESNLMLAIKQTTVPRAEPPTFAPPAAAGYPIPE